jgi:hypothetical protein
LALQRGGCRGLTVGLFFQLGDRVLLGLQLAFQLCNLLALDFDEGSDTARLRLSHVPRTFPGHFRVGRPCWECGEENPCPHSPRNQDGPPPSPVLRGFHKSPRATFRKFLHPRRLTYKHTTRSGAGTGPSIERC